MALLRSGWAVQYSVDGAQWSDDDTGAEYIRIRNREAGGDWSDPIPLPRGADGRSLRRTQSDCLPTDRKQLRKNTATLRPIRG